MVHPVTTKTDVFPVEVVMFPLQKMPDHLARSWTEFPMGATWVYVNEVPSTLGVG